TPMISVWNEQNVALQVVLQAASAKNALIVGTTNNKRLTVVLNTFVVCGSLIKKAGAPPSARLTPFATALGTACTHDTAGAGDPEHGRERRSECTPVAVCDLEGVAAAVRRDRAEQALGASLGDQTGHQPHQGGVVGAFAADELGACAHRLGHPRRRREQQPRLSREPLDV